MSGFLSGWAGENPFYQGFDKRRNAITGFGVGLMSGTDLREGVANGLVNAQQGRQQDDAHAKTQKDEQERQAAINATTEWLRAQAATNPFAADMVGLVEAGALSPNQAFSEVSKMAQGGTSDWAKLNDGTLYNQRTGETMQLEGVGGQKATEYGLTPIWGQFADGTFGYGVQGKDGTFLNVDTGDLKPLDPRALAGERAYGTATGKSGGESDAAAQGDLDAGLAALDLLDQIETHPELPWATGFSVGMGGNRVAGTGRYDFQNLVDQAKSGAFLTAVQQMRGLGALSNNEGQAATQAITRMDTATSKEGFMRALSDYRSIIERGVTRAKERLARMGGGGAPGASAGSGYTVIGVE